jgi:hypothetical protein
MATVLPLPAAPAPPRVGSSTRAVRFRVWLARHPFVLVAMLSPGIVEYLTGSSQLAGLVLSPPLFFVFLAANLGLYVPGVLLIREAKVRWRGGWGTVVLLGVAYAIVEEGLALSTLFNPHASVVGALGFYGHFAGVSWVWLVGVVAVHVVFSISVPIYLLGLALPERRTQPWLSRRALGTVVTVLALDTAALMAITAFSLHFFAGVALVAGSLGVVALLVWAAYRLPPGLFRPWTTRPAARPLAFALVGASFWFGMVLAQALCGAANLPAALAVVLTSLVLAGYLYWFLAHIGESEHAPHLVALAIGLIAPLAVVGAIVQFRAPVVLIADAAAVWFFLFLWNRANSGWDGATPRAAGVPA